MKHTCPVGIAMGIESSLADVREIRAAGFSSLSLSVV